MTAPLSRRDLLLSGAALAALPPGAPADPSAAARPDWVYCLNTATIRGQKLGIVREVEIAAEAGYTAIEPWIDSLRQHEEAGHRPEDLRRRITDLGLTVESGIGFANFLADDDTARAKALEQAKRDMELLARIGGTRIAAPPAGATKEPALEPLRAAERYRALLEAGARAGVTPMLEMWGFSRNLSRLGEVARVAAEADHAAACVLADVYHLHKGGSGFEGLRLLSAPAAPVFHMNDFPAEPARAQITDAHRVHCGEGVAPWPRIIANLAAGGGRKVLSLELFNKEYYAQDPLRVARDGLARMKAAVTGNGG